MIYSIDKIHSISTPKTIYKVESIALVLLLGFELCYYLLIVQTGITQHFNSDLITLLPLFVGGVAGTILSSMDWGRVTNPIHKMIIALLLQLLLSFSYPDFSFFTLGILGISVGMMAPLSIFVFKQKQKIELFFALAIAYTIGTYFFTSFVEDRGVMAVTFTMIALTSSIALRDYKVDEDTSVSTQPFMMTLVLMFWIFLDSNLFETLSRTQTLDIWSTQTYTIIIFHILGLFAAYVSLKKEYTQHILIAILFALSYSFTYLDMPILLAIVYPFVISYYNVVVFSALAKEMSLSKLSVMMVLIAWIASGTGLALALSKIIY